MLLACSCLLFTKGWGVNMKKNTEPASIPLPLFLIGCAVFILLQSDFSVAQGANSQSYLSSADCRAYLDRESKAWDREYSAQGDCWARSQCRNPGSDPKFRNWTRTMNQIRETCSQMAANERQAQKDDQDRQRQEDRQQRESQQRIQLSQQQYQRGLQAEAQHELNRAGAARKWEQDQQRERQQAISTAEARTNRANAAGAAVMGIFNSLVSKSDPDEDSDVDRVYDRTKQLKTQLQKHAMPGGKEGVAVAVQDKSLEELKKYHSQLANDLKATLTEIESFGNTPSDTTSSTSSSMYRAATVLPMNTGGSAIDSAPNPWGSDAPSTSTSALQSNAGASMISENSRTNDTLNHNPWADASTSDSAGVTKSGSDGPIQLASVENPWDTPPASSNASQCDDIRAARVKFKWDWSDQKGRRCFSNASDRANAKAGAVCCSW